MQQSAPLVEHQFIADADLVNRGNDVVDNNPKPKSIENSNSNSSDQFVRKN
jgi:hypothetical protein